MYSAVETALRAALRRDGRRERAGDRRAVVGVQPHGRREPRRVATRRRCRPSSSSTRRRRTRCSRRRTPSCTARSGTSTRPRRFVLCSTAAADRAGVPQDRRVYPLACGRVEPHARGVEARGAAPGAGGAHRRRAHRRPHRDRRRPRATWSTSTAASPSRCASRPSELGLPVDDPDGRPLSVGGGMTFGGGPLNNATFQALARMVPMLRDAPGSTGLLTFISGIITKHGISVWSTTPPDRGFAFADTSADGRSRARPHSRSWATTAAARPSTATPSRTRVASRATRRSSRPRPTRTRGRRPQRRRRARRRHDRRRVVRPRRHRRRRPVPAGAGERARA